MSANVTVGSMTEQINRERLDRVSARGWLAREAAMARSRVVGPSPAPKAIRVALLRLGERIRGTMRPFGTVADLTVPPSVLPR